MKYAKGISWMDDCRIPFVDDRDIPNDMDKTHLEEDRKFIERKGYKPFYYQQSKQGRFTPNLLVCDDVLNDGTKSSIKHNKNYIPPNDEESVVGFSRGKYSGICDMGTNSRYYDLDSWFDDLIFKLT